MQTTQSGEFSPYLGDVYATMAVCGGAILLLLFAAYRMSKMGSPDPRKKVLLPMLAYFMALLALMGFLGSFWSTFKYPTVTVTATELNVGGEAYAKPRPHEIRLESVAASGLGDGGRVLLVQTRDRRTWAFPEERYDLTGMMRTLRGK